MSAIDGSSGIEQLGDLLGFKWSVEEAGRIQLTLRGTVEGIKSASESLHLADEPMPASMRTGSAQ